MLYAAFINGRHPVTIDEISEAAGIPREYLAKTFKELVRQGFLRSQRGQANQEYHQLVPGGWARL
jgi:DNA-binding IscR family transcriptional regulator